MREIGRKEAGELEGFPILWMRKIKNVLEMEERNAKTRKNVKKNDAKSKEGVLAYDRRLCLGQSQWTRRGLRQPREIQWKIRVSTKKNETPEAT